MKLRNFFLPAMALAAALTACNNDLPENLDPTPTVQGVTLSASLQIVDEPASRNEIGDNEVTPLDNEKEIKSAVILVYDTPIHGSPAASLEGHKVIDALYFTFSKAVDGVWTSADSPANELKLSVDGSTHYYATAIVNVGNISDRFVGMSLATLRDYTLNRAWTDDYSYFAMTTINDDGKVGNGEIYAYGNSATEHGFVLNKDADDKIVFPVMHVQRLASRLEFKLDHDDEDFEPGGEDPNYTGVLGSKINVLQVVKNSLAGSDNWHPQLVYKASDNKALNLGWSPYTLTVTAKSPDAQAPNNKIGIELYGENSTSKYSADTEIGNEWTTIEISHDNMSLQGVKLNIGLFKGTLWIGEITLKKGNGDNIMPNSTFTEALDSYWDKWNDSEPASVQSWGQVTTKDAVGIAYPVTWDGAESDMVFMLEEVSVLNINDGPVHVVPHFDASPYDGATDEYYGPINGVNNQYSNGVPQYEILTPAAKTPGSMAIDVFGLKNYPEYTTGYKHLTYLREYNPRGHSGAQPTAISVKGKLFKNKSRVLVSGELNPTAKEVTFTVPIQHRQLGTAGTGDFNMIYRNTIYRVRINVALSLDNLSQDAYDSWDDAYTPATGENTGTVDINGANIILIETDIVGPTGTTPLD